MRLVSADRTPNSAMDQTSATSLAPPDPDRLRQDAAIDQNQQAGVQEHHETADDGGRLRLSCHGTDQPGYVRAHPVSAVSAVASAQR